MSQLNRYLRVLGVFARNSLIRSMMFRANFILESISNLAWVVLNLGLYVLLFSYTRQIGSGWTEYRYFVFLATLQLINSLVEAFLMPNVEEFSELVRSGDLDFALLKPIDTQFLVSLAKIDWSALSNFIFAGCLLVFALVHLDYLPSLGVALLYPLYIACGVVILYSLMIALAATTVWLGRNQSIYDFWFYITNFSRYPMEIFTGPMGAPLKFICTFLIPVLVVVNVPARILAKPLTAESWQLAVFALLATVVSLAAGRWLFNRSIQSYRSASS
ncbi:MAG TPA: ABC-2 family transporter protein [Pirellulales bacterium]|jgi:ABC-2 type transport system permease protein|nr:ABC-2 family transporter protein [Pirellulales bacterium]